MSRLFNSICVLNKTDSLFVANWHCKTTKNQPHETDSNTRSGFFFFSLFFSLKTIFSPVFSAIAVLKENIKLLLCSWINYRATVEKVWVSVQTIWLIATMRLGRLVALFVLCNFKVCINQWTWLWLTVASACLLHSSHSVARPDVTLKFWPNRDFQYIIVLHYIIGFWFKIPTTEKKS